MLVLQKLQAIFGIEAKHLTIGVVLLGIPNANLIAIGIKHYRLGTVMLFC